MENKSRTCSVPFNVRYSPSEVQSLRDEFVVHFYGDVDTQSCVDMLVNTHKDYARKYRSMYKTEYAKYLQSTLNFEVLMRETYDESQNTPFFRSTEIIVHMLEVPFTGLPLYLNSKDDWVVFLSKWRLSHGR